MARSRRVHDDRLLDALDLIEGVEFEGPVWRVTRENRSVIDGSKGSGRWNTSDLSVLYCSKSPDGAIAEINYHLSIGQSVFPSKMKHSLHELRAGTERTLVFASMADLVDLGVDETKYPEMLYGRTQEIASAAAFLGFDGIVAPSARWNCDNLVLFLDSFNLENIEHVKKTPIDWHSWRRKNRS